MDETIYRRYSRQLTLYDGQNKMRVILQTGFYEPTLNNRKRHSHPLGEFYAVIQGHLNLEIDTIQCSLDEGDFCYIAPSMYHCFLDFQTDTQVMRFNVDFSDVQQHVPSPFQFLCQRLSQVKTYETFPHLPGFEIFTVCYMSIKNKVRYSDLTLNGLLTAFLQKWFLNYSLPWNRI